MFFERSSRELRNLVKTQGLANTVNSRVRLQSTCKNCNFTRVPVGGGGGGGGSANPERGTGLCQRSVVISLQMAKPTCQTLANSDPTPNQGRNRRDILQMSFWRGLFLTAILKLIATSIWMLPRWPSGASKPDTSGD